MSERVFVKDEGDIVHTVVFPPGVTTARATYKTSKGGQGPGFEWSLDEIQGRSTLYREVFDHLEATDLPPTTADLHTELAAYKQFATAITASFKDTAKRSHQMDYQAAYDRLIKSTQTKGSEA